MVSEDDAFVKVENETIPVLNGAADPSCKQLRQRLTSRSYRNEDLMQIIKIAKLIHDYIKYNEEGEPDGYHRAIDGVDLELEKGSFTAILGHNGSGKSTLAKHLNGILLPTEGTVWVGEQETRDEAHIWEIRQKAGMVFQNPDNQIIGNVVEEDVAFGPENIGVPTKDIWTRVEESLSAVGMIPYRKKSPNKLSGGQKQRVAIAGVMAMKPECIILDEPTAMLDPNGRKEVIKTIHELNRQEGITVILITHYMEEVIDADRVIVMDEGKVVMDGTPKHIFSQVEQLKSYRLDVPQVTELAYELQQAGMPLPAGILSIEELVETLCRFDPDGRLRRQDMAGGAAAAQVPETDPNAFVNQHPPKDQSDPSGQHPPKDQKDLSADPLIRLKHVSYVYEPDSAFPVKALDDINLEIHRGEFIGLMGHTGSGKSTLVQHLNCLIRPTEGSIFYKEENILEDGYPLKTLRSKVGLVFQYPEHQLFETDVLSDICFGPKNLGMTREEAQQRAREAMELVGLKAKYENRSPFELSGGQKRRVAIAGVVAMKPEVLILDEPTAGLDPHGRDQILHRLQMLHQQKGITIILVSHSMEDVANYASRLIVMDRGKVQLDGTPKEVFRHYERLEKMGLAAPQVTYIAHALRDAGFAIDTDLTTIPQAKQALLDLFGKGFLSVQNQEQKEESKGCI